MKKYFGVLAIFLFAFSFVWSCGGKTRDASRRDEVRQRSDQAMAELDREVKGGPAPITAAGKPERAPAPAAAPAREKAGPGEAPFAKKRPGWMQAPPSDPGNVYGVGAGSDLKSADDAARAEIAAQLKVTVSSSFSNTVQEAIKSSTQGKKQTSSYQTGEVSESQVRSLVEKTTLKGVSIQERWQEGIKIFSLAILSKAGFRDRAMSHLEEGNRNLNARAIAPALREYLRALGEAWVIPDLTVPGSGESIAVVAERNAINLINDISAQVKPVNLSLTSRQSLPATVEVQISDKNDAPIADLPVAAGFVSGQGRLEAGMASNSTGKLHFQIISLSPSSRTAAIALGPDLTRLAELPSDLDLNRVFPPFRGGQVQLSAPAPKILVAISEENLGKPQSPSFVESGLTEGLAQAGFVLIPRRNLGQDPDELMNAGSDALKEAGQKARADFLILGTAKSEYYKNIMGKMEASRVRVNLKVIDGNTGEVLTGLDRSDLTGTGATVELSAVNALKEAAKKVPELVKDKLNQI